MSFTLSILRPDDLLNLRVTCVDLNIETDASGKARLVPGSDADAFLVFTFPPQTITERAYYDAAKAYPPKDPDDGGPYDKAPGGGPPVIGNPDAPGDVPARIGGQSRLVFRLGPTARAAGIELSIEGLLDWSTLEPVVAPLADVTEGADAAARASAPPIRPPAALKPRSSFPTGSSSPRTVARSGGTRRTSSHTADAPSSGTPPSSAILATDRSC